MATAPTRHARDGSRDHGLAALRGDLLAAPFDILGEHNELAVVPCDIYHALIIWARAANDAHDLTGWNRDGAIILLAITNESWFSLNCLPVSIGAFFRSEEKYAMLTIPESIASRVHERLSNEGLQPASPCRNPLRVIRFRDLNRGVAKQPRNISDTEAA